MHFSKTKSIFHFFSLLFVAVLFVNYSGNAPGGNTGAPGEGACNSCHGGNNPQGLDGEVIIDGLPAMVSPGSTYPISVTVTNPNGLSLRAGFQMVALDGNNENAGSMANASANSSIATGNRTYHEHSPAMGYDANRNATWTVDWTAPQDAGNETITFYAVGNITDMNNGGNTSNDLIVFSNQSTMLGGGQQQAADLQVTNLQNFPAAVRRGEAAFYSFDVVNSGNVTADGEYDILMYLSTDQTFSSDDIEAGEVPTGNTPVGTISEVTGGITPPDDLPLGEYYLLIVIDANNTIEELDEDNNVFVSGNTIEVLPANTQLMVNIITQDVNCFGETTGSATAQVMGGSGEYSYQWSTGATGATVNDLEAGTYVLTVSDGGEPVSFTFTIQQPPSIEVEIVEINNNACPNESNGQISINVTGGTPPYIYEWSNGSTTDSTEGLPEGDHDVVITDANGCFQQQVFTLITNDEEAPVITCPANLVTNNCAVPTEYAAPTVMDNCGVLSLELLDGLESGEVFPTGVTTVTYRAYDTANNPAVCSFTVTVDNDLVVIIDDTTPATDAMANGTATITVTGGTPPYTFAWLQGENVISTEEDPTNLAAGSYTLEVRDASGCSFSGMPIEIGMTTNTNDPAFAEHIQLYPNPTRGNLVLQTTNLTEDVQVEVLNMYGQVVQRQFIENANTDSYSIDLQTVSKGNYLVRMTVKETVLVRKISVQ